MSADLATRLLLSRRELPAPAEIARRKLDAEGGCGVIGIACETPLAGRHLLQALRQMRNRGNGKGGGIAAAGLDPEFFGVAPTWLRQDYLLAVAYLDPACRPEVERTAIEPTFEVDAVFEFPTLGAREAIPGLDVTPPAVVGYFARVRPDVRRAFCERHGLPEGSAAEDEIVYQNTYGLNRAFYAATGDKRAFVLSHGKDLLILKMVGYGDDVVRYYRLEDLRAHVWIGHHRYPTKGKVWHPGGAHPFAGMHEALVHNGDFANYASICAYLAQRRIYPLFLTDTEVAVLVYDLLHRVYGYPSEYVIEAMAPTTERDYCMLPASRREIYGWLQALHMRGSPDGPWFFLLAQSLPAREVVRLMGITDTSMLRPQVFALQRGEVAVGFAASEKQAIDAALESLSADDPRFWPRADLYWNARGGSHTDGGAFLFTVARENGGAPQLACTDKFGRLIEPDPARRPPRWAIRRGVAATDAPPSLGEGPPEEVFAALVERVPHWDYETLAGALELLVERAAGRERAAVVEILTRLLDRRYGTGSMKRSGVLALVEEALGRVWDGVRRAPNGSWRWYGWGEPEPPAPGDAETTLVVDARGFPPEGPESLARAIVRQYRRGFRRMVVARTRGQRFIGCGLGPESSGVRLEIYGSPGDYLASGLDGAEVVVHASGQDQMAQIMRRGTLVVHGDVGQTFMYAGKGGEVFILGNAAGRPLINAVGSPRVVINGTCLDYLAESFMAGDPLNGGGFVILNGIAFDDDGRIVELPTPYPGGNLFSLASGGAIYVRDPYGTVGEDQLNGGEIVPLGEGDWQAMLPCLEKNARWFGIPVARLLEVDGRPRPPREVYRKVQPSRHRALLPEEAWVKRGFARPAAAHWRRLRRRLARR